MLLSVLQVRMPNVFATTGTNKIKMLQQKL